MLAINRDLYCDTSLIIEALEYHPALQDPSRPSIYPPSPVFGSSYRPLARGFASYWIDRPFFRVTTGLIPAEVWRTSFGVDRAGLIGHPLDADKLERKLPRNLAGMEMHLSMLEPTFHPVPGDGDRPLFIFRTATPSLADVAFYYQLKWSREISSGSLIADLTGAEHADIPRLVGLEEIFTPARYPGIWAWYRSMQTALGDLDDPQVMLRRIPKDDLTSISATLQTLSRSDLPHDIPMALPTPNAWAAALDSRSGLTLGREVVVAPDDTGRDDPIYGRLVGCSAEEVVLQPTPNMKSTMGDRVRIHFPRLGFVVKPVEEGRAKL